MCQVPGCKVVVSGLKEFNLRCRVCNEHSRAQSVAMSDGAYRFCQQCNKFQPVSEFEDGKRGCREKLLVHNIRRQERRKQKTLQKSLSSFISDIGNVSGHPSEVLQKLMDFVKDGRMKKEDISTIMKQKFPNYESPQESLGGSSSGATNMKRGREDISGNSNSGPAPQRIKEDSASSSSQGEGTNIFPNLWPSTPTQTQTNKGLPIVDSADVGRAYLPTMDPMDNLDHPSSFPSGMFDPLEGFGSTAVPNSAAWEPGDSADGGLMTGATFQAPFKDMLPNPGGAVDFDLLATLPLDSDALEWVSHTDTSPPGEYMSHANWADQLNSFPAAQTAGSAGLSSEAGLADWTSHFCTGPGCHMCCILNPQPSSMPAEMSAYYKDMEPQVYQPSNSRSLIDQHVLRLSMKINDATPADLPTDLFDRVGKAMQLPSSDQSGVTGYIRPGCLHLTVDMLVCSGEEAKRIEQGLPARVISSLLSHNLSWSNQDVHVTLPNSCVVSRRGVTSIVAPPHFAPELLMVQIATSSPVFKMLVRGWRYMAYPTVLCRKGGRYLGNVVESIEDLQDDLDLVTVRLTDAADGVLWVEISDDSPRYFHLTEALPCLSMNVPEVEVELRRMVSSRVRFTKAQATALLADIDTVLHDCVACEDGLKTVVRTVRFAALHGMTALLQETMDAMMEADPSHRLLVRLLQPLLEDSVKSSNVDTVAQVLSFFVVNEFTPELHRPDSFGMSLLHWAALVGNQAVVRLLTDLYPEAATAWSTGTSGGGGVSMTPSEVSACPESVLRCLSARTEVDSPAAAVPQRKLVTLVTPILFGAILLCLRPPLHEWPAWGTVLLLTAICEFLMRVEIWYVRSLIHRQLSGLASVARPGLSLTSKWLQFSDPAMDDAYLADWARTVQPFDSLVLGFFIFKLALCLWSASRVGRLSILVAAAPVLAILGLRTVKQPLPAQRERGNLTIMLLSWAFLFYSGAGYLHEAPNHQHDTITWRMVFGNSTVAFATALQLAAIYPFRMRRCCMSGMFTCLLVLGGFGYGLVETLGDLVTQRPARFAAFAVARALLPAMWAAIGSELTCRLLEQSRLARFLEKHHKAD